MPRKKKPAISKFEKQLVDGMKDVLKIVRGEMYPSKVTTLEELPDGWIKRTEITFEKPFTNKKN